MPVPNPANPRTHRASRSRNRSRSGRGELAGTGETMEFYRSELHRTTSGQLITVTMAAVETYDVAAKRLVTDLKYQHKKSVALTIAQSMAANVKHLPAPDVLTWVPTTDRRRSSRGFDHAELITRHLGALLQRPTERLLRRTSTGHQTGQSRTCRLDAVSFTASPRCAGRDIWIIDDVWTTGSTFRAATTALIGMRAQSVVCIAYAHVP